MHGIVRLLTAVTTVQVASSFGIPDSFHLMQAVHSTAHSLPHVDLLDSYKQALAAHPLPTKMITGATLAVSGDAIAQSQDKSADYDKRRASSFAVFDMAYRALQHFSFPIIIAACHGQYLGSIPGLDSVDASQLAAMEQTLASQLGIVPFFYYPVFFGLTGAMQGLSASGALTRAQENFLPLMKRNLLFWIPMQFIQFGYIQEDLQIPFLSVCGLGWTFILSVAAGSAKSYTPEKEAEEAMILSQLLEEDSSTTSRPTMGRSANATSC
jgi:peroxisomal membrane protein 2